MNGHHNSYQHNENINNSDKGENENRSIQIYKINEKEKNDIQVIMKCYESNILYTCKHDENLKERMAGYTRREIFKELKFCLGEGNVYNKRNCNPLKKKKRIYKKRHMVKHMKEQIY